MSMDKIQEKQLFKKKMVIPMLLLYFQTRNKDRYSTALWVVRLHDP